MLKKLRKGIYFLVFTIRFVRPLPVMITLVVAKIVQKTLNIQLENISFTFLSEKPLNLTVNDITQFSYFFNIFYSEPFKISSPINTAPVVVDGGANIGMSSVYFYTKFPRAHIYAVEASPENICLLKKNLSEIPNHVIDQVAIWNESTELTFNLSHCSRYNSLFEPSEKSRAEKVKALSLLDWLEEKKLEKIDVLKLNVEGAELNAIRGLGKRINDVGIIVGELHPQFVDKEVFLDELNRNNFTIQRLEKMGRITWAFEARNRNILPNPSPKKRS